MMKSFMSMKVNKGRDVRKEKTTKLGFLKGIFRASLSIPKKNRISFIIIWVFSKSSFEFQSITSSERTPFFVYCGDGRLFVTVDRFWSPYPHGYEDHNEERNLSIGLFDHNL